MKKIPFTFLVVSSFIIISAIMMMCSRVGKEKEEQPQIAEDVLKLRKEHAASYRIPDSAVQDSMATARRNRDLFYHTCANGYEDQTVGSEGVAASANVTKLGLQGANIKSWWIGAFYYKIIDGRRWKFWIQWGYAVDRGGLFQAFYVYSISPIYGQQWPLTIINQDNSVPLSYGTRVRFEIRRNLNTEEVPSNTYWSLLRDGQKVLDIDLGVTSFDGTLQSCTESWGTNSYSSIVHVDYLDTYKNGAWSHLPSGNIGSIEWRLEGRIQRPEFQPSEHEFGGRLQTVLNYLLW